MFLLFECFRFRWEFSLFQLFLNSCFFLEYSTHTSFFSSQGDEMTITACQQQKRVHGNNNWTEGLTSFCRTSGPSLFVAAATEWQSCSLEKSLSSSAGCDVNYFDAMTANELWKFSFWLNVWASWVMHRSQNFILYFLVPLSQFLCFQIAKQFFWEGGH